MRRSRGEGPPGSLFEAPTGHAIYLELRNNADGRERRDWLESLWARFSAYDAPDFLSNFRNDPGKLDSLTWEMLLGCKLLEQGFTLLPVKANSPDICVSSNGKRVWVECAMPTRGEAALPDSVRRILPDTDRMQVVDTDKNLLRCTSIIRAKIDQHQSWLTQGICKAGEQYVIAIHGRELSLRIYDHRLPGICGAVYPVGKMFVDFEANSDQVESGYLHRVEIGKATGEPVSTTFFLDPANAHVTGILFSLDWGPFHVSTARFKYAYVPNLYALPLDLDLSGMARICSVSESAGRVRLALD